MHERISQQVVLKTGLHFSAQTLNRRTNSNDDNKNDVDNEDYGEDANDAEYSKGKGEVTCSQHHSLTAL